MTRWAVTKRIEAGEDLKPARIEVISISTRDPTSGPPEMPGIDQSEWKDRYATVEVPEGVTVGMVKGGAVDTVGGYGWASASDRLVVRIDQKGRVTPARRRSARAS